ncbi:MAG: pilus assembly protein FimV [Cryomorphaceae bacterium]|jgi:pilus assembly protein FimV
MARRLATAVLTLGCLHTGVVSALGLGDLKLESFLNEPLSASVDMHSAAGLQEDQIKVRLATSEDFDKLGIDRAYFLTSIKFEVSVDDRGNGTITLSSEDPVLEPYLDFLIEARWPTGRLLREYTVLVDPPVFDSQSPIISASEKVAETEGGEDTAKKKPRGSEASSGTSVSTKKSELPAGEMPQRDFGSNATAEPLAGNQYMIRRDETLWTIADRARPDGTSVHQTMLDIQRLNPGAFIDGNINRIKAGYIVYLPGADDISSNNLEQAQQEVRQQNQDWRDGVASKPQAGAGPSLRISAEPTPENNTAAGNDSALAASSQSEVAENLEESERARSELDDRLASMEEQVETLQRIVSLKDDQIFALQNALADTDSSIIEDLAGLDSDEWDSALEEREAMMAPDEEISESAAAKDAVAVIEPEVSAPVVQIPKVAAPAEPEKSNTLYYIIGLVLAAGLGVFFFLRRRTSEDEWEDDEDLAASDDDVFADVTMPDSDVNLNELDDEIESISESVVDEELSDPLELDEPPPLEEVPENESGYGEHKHDKYASDEAGDALAEADIYIAYGRYPQAVDLLKTAINNDPGNPAYREKLIELSAEMGNKEEAQLQYSELVAIGDSSFIARAEQVLRSAGNGSNWFAEMVSPDLEDAALSSSDSLEIMDELDLTEDTGQALEADFGELEIELPDSDADDDELDLSSDFTDDNIDGDFEDDEDMVFSEDGSEMSTKLDLARAYLDMGDEDGAKQILEEVATDGSAGQKEEAKTLLERLD